MATELALCADDTIFLLCPRSFGVVWETGGEISVVEQTFRLVLEVMPLFHS